MKNERGGISIFLCFALVATIALTGMLTDAARLRAAGNQTVRALDLASLSVLANFESDLKKEYGLFAVSMPAADAQTLRGYAERNLGLGEEQGFWLGVERLLGLGSGSGAEMRLYGFAIENISLAPQMPLEDVDVLERQILEYMKYRAPAALMSGVMSLVSQASSVGNMADKMKIKLEADKKTAEIGKLQQNLRDYLHGDMGGTGVGSKYVENFGQSGARESLTEELISIYGEYVEVRNLNYEAEQRAKRPGADGADERPDLTEQRELRDALARVWDKLYEDESKAYLGANTKAIECIGQIRSKSEEIQALYDKIENSPGGGGAGAAGLADSLGGLGNLAGAGGAGSAETPFADAFEDSMKGSVEKGKAALVDAQSAADKTRLLNENVAALNGIVGGMDQIKAKVLSYSPPGAPVSEAEIRERISPARLKYNGYIDYPLEAGRSGAALPDPREFANDRLGELVKEGDGESKKKLSDIGIDAKTLPSRKSGGSAGSGVWGSADGSSPFGGIDLYNSDSVFTQDSMGNFIDIGNPFAGGLSGARDNLYVNEYILGAFRNSPGISYSLLGGNAARSAFFDAEAEYILNGSEDEAKNISAVRLQIVLMRFILNFLHIYSDPEKVEMAYSIAASLAAWWSFGALTPVVANLIMTAWSLTESIEDANELLDGKKLPFFKLPGDWRSNIGVPNAGKPKTDESKMISYMDYLRMLLLMTPRDKKLSRVNDLIEINFRFVGKSVKTANLYCAIACELETSVNYLFIASPFVPPELRAGHGRRLLKASLTRDLF